MPLKICPTCHKPFVCKDIRLHPTFPFCSRRCKEAELGAWLDGRYVISRPLRDDETDTRTDEAREPQPPDGGRADEGADPSR
jgi:hypothetical protein